MKKIIIFLSVVASIQLSANVYYLAPSGNDNNTGTINSPWFSMEKAWTYVNAGDTVYMRGGTYQYAYEQDLVYKDGTAGNYIKYWNYPGENPIITRSSSYVFQIGVQTDLIYVEGCSYLHFKGLEIAYYSQAPDKSFWFGFRANNLSNSIVENINYHDNGTAFTIREGSGNLILNSDFYNNSDPYSDTPYDGADGLGLTFTNNTNATSTIRGCRAWWNADDGFDLWDNRGYVLIENSWSFWNGYIPGSFSDAGNGSGFKLGIYQASATTTIKREVKNCVAFKNRNWGIVENNAPINMNIYNNTCTSNGTLNYWFGAWSASPKTFRNNIQLGGGQLFGDIGYAIGTDAIQDHNTWNGGVTANLNDFQSLDSMQLMQPRQANGSLPIITFLHLTSGSDLIDAGTNVSLPYNGINPDIGAFEFGPSGNMPPTAIAGNTLYVTVPTASVSINGGASDTDGTITSYTWTQQSGPNSATLNSVNTLTLSASGLVIGTYVFRLTVTDNLGATAFDDVTVIVNSTPPTVAITTPTINTVLNGTVSINATATDNVSVDRVRFYYTTGSAPTPLFSDNFNRTNSTNLGSNWTERYTASNFQINTNKMRINTNDGNVTAAYTTSGLISADYSVEAIMSFPTLNSIFAGVGGRMVNNGSNDVDGYMAYAEPGAQEVYIYKRSAGNWTQLGSYATTILANTNYTLKLELQGNTLKLFWNGLAVITTTDNTFTNMGYAGVTTGTGFTETNITWDDFKITSLGSSVTKTFIASDNNAPYSASWNTSLVSDGSYTLIAVAYNTLGDSTTSADVPVIVNNSIATGFTQNKTMQNSFTIYPNPVVNELIIETNFNSMSTIIITDVLNKIVKTLEVKDKIIKVDVSDLRTGVYFITETSHNTKTRTQKFIKQ